MPSPSEWEESKRHHAHVTRKNRREEFEKDREQALIDREKRKDPLAEKSAYDARPPWRPSKL